MELGQPRQVDAEVWKYVTLFRICRSLDRCEIPEQVVDNKTPRQEVVNRKVGA